MTENSYIAQSRMKKLLFLIGILLSSQSFSSIINLPDIDEGYPNYLVSQLNRHWKGNITSSINSNYSSSNANKAAIALNTQLIASILTPVYLSFMLLLSKDREGL